MLILIAPIMLIPGLDVSVNDNLGPMQGTQSNNIHYWWLTVRQVL